MDATVILSISSAVFVCIIIVMAMQLRYSSIRAAACKQYTDELLDRIRRTETTISGVSQTQRSQDVTISELKIDAINNYHRGVKDGRAEEQVAHDKIRSAYEEAQQRVKLLQEQVSDLTAKADGNYHRGVKDGREEERKEYALMVTPFVSKQSKWLVQTKYLIGYRLQLMVKGCPAFSSTDIPLEQKSEIDKEMVLSMVKTAIDTALPHGAATSIPTTIVKAIQGLSK